MSDSSANDYSVGDLWMSMAELFEEVMSTDPDDPLRRPLLSDQDIRAGAALGFSPEQARIVLSDEMTMRDVERIWSEFAKAYPNLGAPKGIRQTLEREQKAGGPQWHAVLRGLADCDDRKWHSDWPDIVNTLPQSAQRYISDDAREGWSGFEVNIREQFSLSTVEALADGATIARGPGSQQASWDDSDWDIVAVARDIRAGAKLVGETLRIGVYRPSNDGAVDVKVFWLDGSSQVVRLPRNVPEVTITTTEPPVRLLIHQARRTSK